MRRIPIIVPLLALLWPALSAAQDRPRGVPKDATPVEVLRIIDGDKVRVELDGKEVEVRLIGADAPERNRRDDPDQCFADESADRLAEFLFPGRTVHLEADDEDRDGKDRLLRYVWVAADNGRRTYMANERMIAEGFSGFTPMEGNARHDDRFADAEDAAKAEDAGLWGACGGVHVDITPTPEPGSSGDPSPVGATINTEGQDITLTGAYTAYEYGFSTPKGGYVFLVLSVTFVNVDAADKGHGYGEGRFSGEDIETGADYDTLSVFGDGALGDGDLSPGEYVSGTVVLEVQETSGGVLVEYDANYSGGSEVYWLVDL